MRTQVIVMGLLLTTMSYSQILEVDGSIQIADSEDLSPQPGTIKWTGTDFLGWNGTKWISLTSGIAFESQVEDIDGHIYQTVKIGNQEWMAENLRTTRYADGTEIPQVNNPVSWQAANYGAWCYYDTASTYALPYGILYNWYAVNDGRKLCPTGWHEPSDGEWNVLVEYLDPMADTTMAGNQSAVAGVKLKEAGTAHWGSSGGTNESGFTGLPGGLRITDGLFFDLGFNGNWWSSTESGGTTAWSRTLSSINQQVARLLGFDKRTGLSVRCIRD